MPAPRFPSARIKKIMQLDEECGQVAKLTPVAVSAALECYLRDLLTATAAFAGNTGTVHPYHLKKVIDGTPRFDSLKDVVKDVKMPSEQKLKRDAALASVPARKRNKPANSAAVRGSSRGQGRASKGGRGLRGQAHSYLERNC